MLTSPTRTGPAPVIAALGHLLWTTAVVIGAPIALARFFGWPLPTSPPDWGEVVSTPLQLVDPVVILNVFVCLAWICWAVVVVYVVLDIVDAARGVGQRLHRLGPFSIVAAKLVGSVLLLISLARPNPSHAAAPTPIAVVQVHEEPVASWQPAPAAPLQAIATETEPAAPNATAPTPAAPVYVVQRGDNLWDIAEAQLGSGFRWSEIHDLNRDLVADPGIICIGWELTLPVDAAIASSNPAPPVADAAPPAEVAPAPLPPSPWEPSAEDNAAPTTTAVPAPAPDVPRPAAPAPEVTATPPHGEPVEDDGNTVDDDALLPALVGVVPGITGATVLATGLLLLLRQAQRRRAVSGGVVRRPIRPLERTLVAAADVPLVRWAGQELAMLGEQLAGRRLDAEPVAVEISEDYGLELLWNRPFPNAPAPWEAIPGAWAWRLLYDPEAPIPVAERPALIAGLVTFGTREGRQLLIDLEGLGSLAVTGDPVAVENFVRAVATELGSSDDVADAFIAIGPGLVEDTTADLLPRLDVVDVDERHQRLSSWSRSTEEALTEVGTPTTFAYRLYATPVLPLEVNVLVATASDRDPDDLVACAPPQRGVAALIVGHAPNASAHLKIAADGTARLEPLGVTFCAAGLPLTTEHAIGQLLTEEPVPESPADVVLTEPELPLEYGTGTTQASEVQEAVTADGRPLIDLRSEPGDAPVTPAPADGCEHPAPRMLVRLLGVPSLDDGPELGRQEMVIVALLACLGRPARKEDIQEAVWGGRPVAPRTIWNVVGRSRKQLGTWDDKPILRNVQRPQNTIELDPGVLTDLDLLRALHKRAEEVPSSEAMGLLRAALDLVQGPPFDADGYEWARVGQHAHEAERLIQSCATTLIDLAREVGDLDLARHAVLQGLRGLPGNETLYRARMRIEDAAGNAAAVRAAFTELSTYLGDLEAVPSPETESLYRRLGATAAGR